MELTRKDLMVKNLKKWKRQMIKVANSNWQTEFWPQTFRLPEVSTTEGKHTQFKLRTLQASNLCRSLGCLLMHLNEWVGFGS